MTFGDTDNLPKAKLPSRKLLPVIFTLVPPLVSNSTGPMLKILGSAVGVGVGNDEGTNVGVGDGLGVGLNVGSGVETGGA